MNKIRYNTCVFLYSDQQMHNYFTNYHTATRFDTCTDMHKICYDTFVFLYSDQHTHNYVTNYHTATCFDTIVSSSGSL